MTQEMEQAHQRASAYHFKEYKLATSAKDRQLHWSLHLAHNGAWKFEEPWPTALVNDVEEFAK
jgi:hypothetical protein